MIAPVSLFETDQAEPIERDQPQSIPVANGDDVNENVYLIGRPPLGKFLRFMAHEAVNGESLDEGALTDEWRAAHDHIRTLEKEEAGIADHPPITSLDPRLEPLRDELLKDPLIVNGFNTVPTNIMMVELDRMVVYQKHIDLDHVRKLKEKLGPAPSDEEIFRACLQANHTQPPVKWSRAHRDTYVFMSPSNDLRFLGTMRLKAKHISDYPPPGTLVGVIGIAVGFGSNFMNAIYAENRLVLNNGSHRAYALRELGITHAPCIVQRVSSREELDVVASGDLREHPDLYLRHPRPSILKDYFNPKLRKIIPIHRRLRQVTIKFETDEAYVPAV
jgi:hypothetical protein